MESNKQTGALSRRDAAQYLAISTRKLDELLTNHQIPKIKIGRKTVVRVCDADAFLARKAGEVSA